MKHKLRSWVISGLFVVASVVAFRWLGYDLHSPTYILAGVIILIGDAIRDASE